MVRYMEVLMRLVPEDGVLTLLCQGVKRLVRDHPTLLEGVYQRIPLRGLGVVDRNLLILDEDQLILGEGQVGDLGLEGGHILQPQFHHTVVCPR
jgi:hypothetical protein